MVSLGRFEQWHTEKTRKLSRYTLPPVVRGFFPSYRFRWYIIFSGSPARILQSASVPAPVDPRQRSCAVQRKAPMVTWNHDAKPDSPVWLSFP